MKFRAIIIEDESLARKRLKLFLQKYADIIEIIGESANGRDGLIAINSLKPDLIFLDIQMPGMTGFEMLQNLEDIPLVIFTTAYDEYALKAFDTNAIDYLLKPISEEKLEKAIKKLQHFAGNEQQFKTNLLELINRIDQSQNDYIKVKTGAVTKLIKYKDIYFFRAEDKYTFLHTKDKKYILSKSLHEMEKSLSAQFKRIHRSAVINSDHVREIIQLSGSKSIVVMKDENETELPVSRRMKEVL